MKVHYDETAVIPTTEIVDVRKFTDLLDEAGEQVIECQTGTLNTDSCAERFIFARSIYDGFGGIITFTDRGPVIFKSGFPLAVEDVINGVLREGGTLKNVIWGKGTPWRLPQDDVMKKFSHQDLGEPKETTFFNVAYDKINIKLIYCYGEVKLKRDGKFKPQF